MASDKIFFWVPSFPKSGNTWLRLILCGLFFTEDGNIKNLKLLNKIPSYDNLDNFQFIKNISLKDYNEIFNEKEYNEASILAYSKYWIESQKRTKINNGIFGMFKTHNARIKINNYYYTNSLTTAGFIYISRDPRDIAVSYSHHINKNFDYTINFILNGQIMEKQKINNKMPEITLNWKDHYLSWKNFSMEVPSLFIKYEDMIEDIEKEINKIIDFFFGSFNIEINNKKNRINNIIASTKFEKLKKIEDNENFSEKSENSNFFRKGFKNQWISELSKEQINKINKAFLIEMKKLGYIN